MDNRTLAQRLTSVAHELERRHASLFRARAYRKAAETVLGLDRPVEELLSQGGGKLLRRLPGVGPHISRTIEELIRSNPAASS